MIKINSSFHNHSTFSDGDDSLEDNILSAISLGVKNLGFSDHAKMNFYQDWAMTDETEDTYIKSFYKLREKYSSDIKLHLGIEQDVLSPVARPEYEYIIGAVHFTIVDGVPYGIDEGFDTFNKLLTSIFKNDYLALAKNYYADVKSLPEKTGCQIIAHFDLLTKYNEGNKFFDMHAPKYLELCGTTLEDLVKKGMIIEVNTGAISRRYRKSPYPETEVLKIAKDLDAKLIVSADSHKKDNLLYLFDETYKMLKDLGFSDSSIINNDFLN